MGPGPDGVRIVRPAMCQPSDPAEPGTLPRPHIQCRPDNTGPTGENHGFRLPGDRPQNRSRFYSLRVLIAQNPVGKRLIRAIFGAAKFARIQVGLPTPATARKIAPDFATCGF